MSAIIREGDPVNIEISVSEDGVEAAGYLAQGEAAGATPRTDAFYDECYKGREGEWITYTPDSKAWGHARTLERELSAARQRIEGLEAEHKAQACHGESLTDTLNRLRRAADTFEAEWRQVSETAKALLARATAAESRLAAVEAERDAAKTDAQMWQVFDECVVGAAMKMGKAFTIDPKQWPTDKARMRAEIDSAIRHLKEKS